MPVLTPKVSDCHQCNQDVWGLGWLGETNHIVHPLFRACNDSVVPVLGFADNVFCNPTPRANWGKFWESTGLQGSMALFLCLECWLLNNHGSTPVLCPSQISGLSYSLYCLLLQKYLLNFSASPGWRDFQPHPIPPLSELSPTVNSRLQGCIPGSS